jgi:hypothetical protein
MADLNKLIGEVAVLPLGDHRGGTPTEVVAEALIRRSYSAGLMAV